MEQVIWKPVVGYEDRYVVSNEGEVKSLDTYVNYRFGKRLSKGRIKPTYRNDRGYTISYVEEVMPDADIDNAKTE